MLPKTIVGNCDGNHVCAMNAEPLIRQFAEYSLVLRVPSITSVEIQRLIVNAFGAVENNATLFGGRGSKNRSKLPSHESP